MILYTRIIPGSVVVKALNWPLEGRRYDYRPFRFQATTPGKLASGKVTVGFSVALTARHRLVVYPVTASVA